MLDVLIDYALEKITGHTDETGGSVSGGEDCTSAFLKTGRMHDTFHMLEKAFSFKKRLNNSARIDDYSGLIFLRTLTGILSWPVAFIGLRFMVSLETSLDVITILLRLCSGRLWNMGSGMYCLCPLMLSQWRR